MKVTAVTLVALLISTSASADCDVDVSDFVGWTIAFSGTVTGYVTEDGGVEASFEGCEYGRKLIVDEEFVVTCEDDQYDYSYRPDIVILSNGYRRMACIEDNIYELSE